MTAQIRVRDMKLAEVKIVVKIHLKSFPNFFLTSLGPAFLSELFTATIADPDGIGLVAELNAQPVGYVIGTVNPNGFYVRLARRRWLQFCLASLPALLKKPLIFRRLLRALSISNKKLPAADCATLMSICTDPDYQGRGTGKSLTQAFLAKAFSCGAGSVNLTTDAVNNDNVNQFYRSMGFKLIRTFLTPEGRSMNEYWVQFGPK